MVSYGLQLGDVNFCSCFSFRDFHLFKGEDDTAWVIINDNAFVAKRIEDGFAATSEVVAVEEARSASDKAHTKASRASFFSLVRIQWFRPSMVFRLGVRYPGSHRRSGSLYFGVVMRLLRASS